MAIRLHGSARTTPRIRAELQVATSSNRALAKFYGINVKTVAKWRSRSSVEDQPMGPRDRGSRHLHADQEQQIIELRQQGVALDDLMGHMHGACTEAQSQRTASLFAVARDQPFADCTESPQAREV